MKPRYHKGDIVMVQNPEGLQFEVTVEQIDMGRHGPLYFVRQHYGTAGYVRETDVVMLVRKAGK